MPELPEVETVRRDLDQYIKGKKITEVVVKPDFAKKIEPSVKVFEHELVGKTVKNVRRRGKLLFFDLKSTDHHVLAHLKMTGQFVFQRPDGDIVPGGHPIEQTCDRPDNYNKVMFSFGRHGKLYYNDVRKFGYLKLVDGQAAKHAYDKFGLEPLDKGFTLKHFREVLKRKENLAIKKVLLMQDLIAGIGNIYADESCFAAGIRCDRKIKTLSEKEIQKLHEAIKRILKKAVKYRRTSVANYIDCLGEKGSYAQFLNVYHRVGKICKKCGKAEIKRSVVGGRGTAYCPVCQK